MSDHLSSTKGTEPGAIADDSTRSACEEESDNDDALLLAPLMAHSIDWLAVAAFVLAVLGLELWLLSGLLPLIGR